jgi:hypothetical protein
VSRAGSRAQRERRAIVALAAVSLVVHRSRVSVPIETWWRLPGRPALHDITIAVGALRRLVGWCAVLSWPTYHLATQRTPSAVASVLYLAVVATWAAATTHRSYNVRR